MKVVYIAGRFTAPTQWAIAENIREAERWGLRVAEAGAMPLIPHANTAHFHGLKTAEFWYAGTLELLKRCDGILCIPGWLESKGARAEHDYAAAHGIEVWGVAHLENGDLENWVILELERDINEGRQLSAKEKP